jgi:hypothetical protein
MGCKPVFLRLNPGQFRDTDTALDLGPETSATPVACFGL